MRINRCVASLLVAALLTGLIAGTALATVPEMQLELQFTFAEEGESATAQLVCENNPGLASAQFTLGFDETVLDCTKVQIGTALLGMMDVTNPDGGKGAVVAAAGATGIQRDGVMAEYEFAVLKEGNCAFLLEDTYFALDDGTQVTFTVSGLEQTVESGPDSSDNQFEWEDPTEDGPTEDDPAEEEPTEEEPAEDDSTEGEPAKDQTGDVQEESAVITFGDTDNHWAEKYILKAAERGLVNGYPNGNFGPGDLVTRGQFVAILWRNAGQPQPSAQADFPDLDPTQTYYLDAIAWAKEKGYVGGYPDGTFGPNDPVTRDQVAVILQRMYGQGSGGERLWSGVYDKNFTDSNDMTWSKGAVYWAVYNEVWCDKDAVTVGNTLRSGEAASRAEVAVMVVKYQDGMGGNTQ